MTTEFADKAKRYKPDIGNIDDLIGLSMHSAKGGDQVEILQRSFFTSYQDNHRHFFDEILRMFPNLNLNELNEIVIVLRNKKCYIYQHFPVKMKIRSKVSIPAGSAVFENQILDIVAIKFEDDVFNLDVRDGDKFVWLFRIGWSFGLYFDFSGQLSTDELEKILGECYKQVKYHSLYSFVSSKESFASLLDLGWFPFVQLLGGLFSKLQLGVADKNGVMVIENEIVRYFSQERIDQFTQYWWKNKIFAEKKDIITAALSAYNAGSREGAINCINTLVGQIEGIVRLDYHKAMGRRASTKELVEYLRIRANESFSDPGSLGFPGPFLGYIEKVFFRPFDVEKQDIELSRHSVQHGVARQEDYTRVRALQLILVLDQIYFYLQGGKIRDPDI